MKTNIKTNVEGPTLKYTSLIALYIFPVLSFAQFNGVRGLLTEFRGVLNLLVPVIFGLALVYFLWGASQFILHAGDAKTREEGKQKMIWGIVALFVMASIYGILGFIGNLIGVSVNVAGGGATPLWIGDAIPGTTNG